MIDTLVFSGGGNRCFWQAGLWDSLCQHLDLQPKRVLATSGGAYVACGLFAGVMPGLLESASRHFFSNNKNFYLSRLIRGERPFPHPYIYRQCLLENLDLVALQRLQKVPPIHMMTAIPPKFPPLPFSLSANMMGYLYNKFISKRVHSTWSARLGFEPGWHSTHEMQTPEQLVDAVCASSSVPPAFPLLKFGGRIALDGGYFDSVPLVHPPLVKEGLGKCLVLLTRRYRETPKASANVLYCEPSSKIAVKNYDATCGQHVLDAYRRGYSDAEEFLPSIEAFVKSGIA